MVSKSSNCLAYELGERAASVDSCVAAADAVEVEAVPFFLRAGGGGGTFLLVCSLDFFLPKIRLMVEHVCVFGCVCT